MFLIFLSSGLFLGWSLGANDAANVFGTAVGTKMIRFRTAAILCSLFVLLGAVIGGQGTTDTLNTLGGVDILAGAFTVAMIAAFTVFLMTRAGIPVSTSQAIVGAIIGWNLFVGYQTESQTLTKILSSWVLCPLLSAIFGILIFLPFKALMERTSIHLLTRDLMVRWGLILVGSFGAYSLGANNIANVMGVFVSSSPLTAFNLFGIWNVSPVVQLFFIGGIAISVGVFTYSHRVMKTVGQGLFKLSPEVALIVILAQALVLFLFSSEKLEYWLLSHNLPALPLVPVSSTQAVIGAITGIALFKGGGGIRFKVLGKISSGWLLTPLFAMVLTFISLFVVENVFDQTVYKDYSYHINEEVIMELQQKGLDVEYLNTITDKRFSGLHELKRNLKQAYSTSQVHQVAAYSKLVNINIDSHKLKKLEEKMLLDKPQIESLRKIENKHFDYTWQLKKQLVELSPSWKKKEESRINRIFNKDISTKLDYITNYFSEVN